MRSSPWKPIQSGTAPGNAKVWVLRTQELRPGDVVLSTTAHIVSLGIRAFTLSDISHAALHVGGGFLIEAVGEGVRRIHGRSLIFPNEDYVQVLRPKELSDDQIEELSRHARSLLYRPFSRRAALGSLLPFCRASDDPGRFCSQVVAEAYSKAEAPLFMNKNPSAITPARIAKSGVFEPITDDIVRMATCSAVSHALGEMQPAWKLNSVGNTASNSKPTPEIVQAAIQKSAEVVMARYDIFRPPYHYFDVLLQMTERWQEDPQAVRVIDDVVTARLQDYDAAWNGVEPQSTIPGLISDTPDPNLPLVFDRGPTEEHGEEVMQMQDDILAGREWDEREWNDTIDEMKSQQQLTELHALTGTILWLSGDFGRVQATYRWLAMDN